MTEAPSGIVRSKGCPPPEETPEETAALDAGTPPPAGAGGVAGHDTAMTVWTPVRWWGVPLLRAVFFVVRHTGITLPSLRKLAFIDYARWAMVKEFPKAPAPHGVPGGLPRQGRDPRRRHHLLFESNFNGTWDQYIDTFAQVIPTNIRVFWGSSINFPGPLPTVPLRAWVDRHHFEVQYYESAEDATATIITSALHLERELRRFARRSRHWDAETFSQQYRRLLTRVEADL
jgi:hypothetical protein